MNFWKRKPPENLESLERTIEKIASLRAQIEQMRDKLERDPTIDDRERRAAQEQLDRRRRTVQEQLNSLTSMYEKLSELHRRAKN